MLVAVHAAAATTNHFRRARVQGFETRKRTRKVVVTLVDEGPKLILDPERLLELPAHLQELPDQAVELIVSRFQPLDEDTEFTPEVSASIAWSYLNGRFELFYEVPHENTQIK